MEYLGNFGFSDIMINNIMTKNDEDTINYLTLYKDDVSKIIEYFKSIGIKDIYGLLLYRPHVFFEELDDIKDLFDNCGINQIVEMINEDQVNFELLGL